MYRTTRKTAWARALALALAATLVASPALARSKKGHGRHRGHPHAREWQRHGGHRHHAGCGHVHNVYYRDRDDDVDELLLGLGLGAVGITALALFAQPPRPAYAGYGGYASPAPASVPIDWNAYDDGVAVVSEGYNERGEFCREFQKEIRVGGRIERGWGIACLQEDGSWRVTR
jgi:hypothetical protein